MAYSMTNRIRYSECGEDKKATIGAIINYFQDCSSEQSESLGVGVAYLREKKRAWILISWQVEISRYPEMGEEIVVSTWSAGIKGFFGPRCFVMKTPEGELLARANTMWAYVDTETGHPTKADEEEIRIYGEESPLDMEKVSRKIFMTGEPEIVGTFPVRRYHIDTNHHVNNSWYIQLAAESLTEDFCPKKVRVEYKKAAHPGDEMVLKCVREEGKVVAALCDKEDATYATVEFTED